ncbi:hypothetical protein P4G96_10585 [Bacillus cereus]|nr:hypothetical protein [Bacillus cereus]MEB8666274.1 hypothetical protein [Bacillus cereus]
MRRLAKTEQERLIELRNQSANNNLRALLKGNDPAFWYFAKEHRLFSRKITRLELIDKGVSQEGIDEINSEIAVLEKQLTEDSDRYLGEKKKPTAMGS